MSSNESKFFFEFARSSNLGRLAFFQGTCRHFQQISTGRVAILSYECHGLISKHRNDHSATVMVHNFALVSKVTFLQRINSDTDYTSVEDSLAFDQFWELIRWRCHLVPRAVSD